VSSESLSAEIREVRDFLASVEPYQLLPPELLARAAATCTVHYRRAGEVLLTIGDEFDAVYVVVMGSVELRDDEGILVERLGEGGTAGVVAAISGMPIRHQCTLLEDSLLYRIDGRVLAELRHGSETFDHYFVRLFEGRLSARSGRRVASSPLLVTCRQLVRRPPVTIAPTATVQEAAQLMTAEGVSSLVVTDRGQGLSGIVTDRDLRSRILAEGRQPTTLVGDVMSSELVSIDADRPASDAQLALSKHNVHHLPVMDASGQLLGLITTTDLNRARSDDPVLMVGEIAKAATPAGIAAITARLPRLIEGLMVADALAEVVGRVVTTVTDAATQQLCRLAEEELGPPPMAYAFVCFGSQARHEQTAFTDQDNALILAADASGDAATYFEALARFVCDGLAEAGYRLCPGDIMATNPRWRVGVASWERYVSAWVTEPDPEAVLNASVFFDTRHLHGDQALTERYLAMARSQAEGSQLFLGQMAANAAEFRPPLGFFRRFVVEKGGDQKDRFDLKRSGVTPVVELARVYALEAGVTQANTYDRLRSTGETMSLAPSDAADLAVALEHIAYVRLQHQRRQLEVGERPDNHLDPTHLSPFEQDQLKMAFVTIDRHQDAMRRHFRTGQMG
jgi:CBS domain-containing protein